MRIDLLAPGPAFAYAFANRKREYGIHPIAIDPKGDKVMRVTAQTAKIESGAVRISKRTAGIPRGAIVLAF
jgi:phage terminase large subunit-like protein